jgi:hypothetical protein
MSFIRYHTTCGQSVDSTTFDFASLSLKGKAAHLVRQTMMNAYLDMVYGKDLWFLFKDHKRSLSDQYYGQYQPALRHQHFDNPVEAAFYHNASIMVQTYLETQGAIEFITRCELLRSIDGNAPGPLAVYYMDDVLGITTKDGVPKCGSIDWARGVLCHLHNSCAYTEERAKISSIGLLSPVTVNKRSYVWKEHKALMYYYEPEKISSCCQKLNFQKPTVFMTYLGSMTLDFCNGYLEGLFGLLSSFMIDPDYCWDLLKPRAPYEEHEGANAYIFKGCYKTLFGDTTNKVYFPYLSLEEKPVGFSNVDACQSFFWLVSYTAEFLRIGDSASLRTLLLYFEPNLNERKLSDLLKIMYKFPELTLEERNKMFSSTIGMIIGSLQLPSMEADDDTPDVPETPEIPDEDDNPTDDPDDDPSDEPDDAPDDDPDDDPDDEPDDDTADPVEPAAVDTTTYAFDFGPIEDLDDMMSRLELDRRISAILTNDNVLKSITGYQRKLLRNLQRYYLYLVNKSTLQLLIKKLNYRSKS